MAKSANQKSKLLYLSKILLEQTDEDHPITVPEMIQELAKRDIKAERKSIYDDFETLSLFGLMFRAARAVHQAGSSVPESLSCQS